MTGDTITAIKKAEHERIWLEPDPGDDPEGRMWCQHNMWGEDGVEYVLASTLESLQRENAELCNLADRLKLEAQGHAIEARGANSTIAEIYQIISGGKGEPGNWNGAKPVRKYAEASEAEVKRLQAEIDRKSSMPGDHRYWEGRYRDEAAENERLNAILEPFRSVSKDWVDENGWTDVACQKDRIVDWFGPSDFRALASTGGEHHAK